MVTPRYQLLFSDPSKHREYLNILHGLNYRVVPQFGIAKLVQMFVQFHSGFCR